MSRNMGGIRSLSAILSTIVIMRLFARRDWVLLLIVVILVLTYHPSYYSDADLRGRFLGDRADLERLVRLFAKQHGNKISLEDRDRPAVGDEPIWAQIKEILTNDSFLSVARADDGHIDVLLPVRNVGWNKGRYYYFEYYSTEPKGQVKSLFEARPYTLDGTAVMHLDDKWYASATEDQ